MQKEKKTAKKPSKKSSKRKAASPDHLKATKNPRVRAEYNDFDYIKTLPPELQEYMAKFAGEYYGASIDVKADKSRPYKTAIHQTMKQVKKARDANNHRNNDVYGSNRANGLLFDVQNAAETKDGWYITNPDLQEMHTVSTIDNKEDQEELTIMEWLNCRRYCQPEARPKNDHYICSNYKLLAEEFEKLIYDYENKLITKRKIEALIEQGKLQEYLRG